MLKRNRLNKLLVKLIFLVLVTQLFSCSQSSNSQKPNVILILTDDQGYGDLSAHGNPLLKTPEMDKLYEQSVRFTDFHVAPMCTPTRSQLLSGYDAMRNGATAVCQGRSMLRSDMKIMPQYFAEAGYATGLFGKWHLGDSYPYRPRFRGFQEVISFRAFGITSLADYWGNTYFDPVFMHNGVDKKYEGYCTDIFFNEAMSWMKKCKDEKKPFFLYLPTNTPHEPDIVAEKYAEPYKGLFDGKTINENFYGMIANLDENIGKLEKFLKENNLRENTILIFMSDNGTQSKHAQAIYNAGMRGKKKSVYEGGHRVPLFVRWIDGKLQHGTDISELTQVQDLLPTLIDLCGLESNDTKFDGTSLAGLLKEGKKLEDRKFVIQYNISGEKWDPAVVLWKKWRLANKNELYNIETDPAQTNNVITKFPEISREMEAHYNNWYKDVKPEFEVKRDIIIGSEKANPLMLYASDWDGDYCDNPGRLIRANGNGFWDLIVENEGTYEIELFRWSEESQKPLIDSYDGISEKGIKPIVKAQLIVGDFNETVLTKPEDKSVKFKLKLNAGNTTLKSNLFDKDNNILCGAMYVKVTRLTNQI
ncbi:arylsulfatase [Lutibacter sp.]|uniref:arylsulfatase n=1 Tax=Lutibacter sp. TaxID=1925666 RepID=UPI00356A7DA3